eukprot:2762877-Rhodomonas_salina.3
MTTTTTTTTTAAATTTQTPKHSRHEPYIPMPQANAPDKNQRQVGKGVRDQGSEKRARSVCREEAWASTQLAFL